MRMIQFLTDIRFRLTVSIFPAALFWGLTGCGASGPPDTASGSATASGTATINPRGATLNFPSVDGYGASFVYSANDAPAGTIATSTLSNSLDTSLPSLPPKGTELVNATLTLSQTVTFTNWYRLPTTITLPASIETQGHSFAAYGYDLTAGVEEGWNPGTVTGRTIAFGAGLGPVTLKNHTYLYILTMR